MESGYKENSLNNHYFKREEMESFHTRQIIMDSLDFPRKKY